MRDAHPMPGGSLVSGPAARLILDLPAHQMSDFLLDSVEPALRLLKRKRELRYWIFSRVGGQRPTPGMRLVLFLVPHSPVPARALGWRARKLLKTALQRQPGRFRKRFWGALDLRSARNRFGGDSGLRIYGIFCRCSTPLAIEMLRLLRRSSALSSYEIGFGSLFFFLDMFQVSPQDMEHDLNRWIAFFGDELCRSKEALRVFEEQAHKELFSHPALCRLLEALRRDGWRGALQEPLKSLLVCHERSMRRIGRLLRWNEPHFSADKPRHYVLFHSYLHNYYLRLDLSGSRELFMMILFRAWLHQERRKTSGNVAVRGG